MYRSTDKYCKRECEIADKGKPTTIPRRSQKGKKLDSIYKTVRIEVLTEANFKCFVEGCTRVATTCEHRQGKEGYADKWARDNDVHLYVDKRFLEACCLHHNLQFENDSELSKKYQLSRIHGGERQ